MGADAWRAVSAEATDAADQEIPDTAWDVSGLLHSYPSRYLLRLQFHA